MRTDRKRPQAITIDLGFGDNSVSLCFSDGARFTMTDKELAANLGWSTRLIDLKGEDGFPVEPNLLVDDLSHQAIINSWQIVVIDVCFSRADGPVRDPKVWRYTADVNHLLKTITLLWDKRRQKFADWVARGNQDWKFHSKNVLTLRKFQSRPGQGEPPVLTAMEAVKHPNNRNGSAAMAKCITTFRKAISEEMFKKFMADLSLYLGKAYVGATHDGKELWFDGRSPGMCGFNGAFILRSGEYSIHT